MSEQGNDDAAYAYGYMLWQGQGIREDRTEAIRVWRWAAKLGNDDANEALKGVTWFWQRWWFTMQDTLRDVRLSW
jgi:TPR repeat protein